MLHWREGCIAQDAAVWMDCAWKMMREGKDPKLIDIWQTKNASKA